VTAPVPSSDERARARDPRLVVVLGLVTTALLGALWWWIFHPEPVIPEPPPTAPARIRAR
jgi:hypothetical protein